MGRPVTDKIVAAHGRARVIQASCAVAAASGLSVVAALSELLAISGRTLLGLGLGPIAPTVLGAAPAMTSAPAPGAIAGVSTLGYLGSFTGPPLIGAVAEHSNLSLALILLAVAASTALLLARNHAWRDAKPATASPQGLYDP